MSLLVVVRTSTVPGGVSAPVIPVQCVQAEYELVYQSEEL